jgi:hypothetical protein
VQTARSLASATCCRDIRRPTGSDPVAAASPRGRGPMASSTSRLLPAGCRCGGPAKPWLWLRPPTAAGARDGPAARCQLDRLADLVPPPRKHRHRYHGVFAPNHKLRRAVTSLAIGNVGKRQEAATGGHGGDGHATEGCCDAHQKLRSHDTSRKSVGETHGPGGGGVSARVPLGVVATSGSLPSSRSRGRSGRFSHTSASRSSLRPSLPPVARRSTGASSCRSMTIAKRLTSCP